MYESIKMWMKTRFHSHFYAIFHLFIHIFMKYFGSVGGQLKQQAPGLDFRKVEKSLNT